MPRRIHILQHVAFEGPALIKDWAESKDLSTSYTKFYENYILPEMHEFDFLIIMGGPMSVYESHKYSWIEDELNFIQKTIEYNKPVLGICLGAQMIASSLNARVYPGKHKEIAWLPVKTNFRNDMQLTLGKIFPENYITFHWHGDTFDIPEGAIGFAKTDITPNQAFIYKNNVVAIQFHMETTSDSLSELIKYAGNEIVDEKPYIQLADIIKENHKNYYSKNKTILFDLLNYLTDRIN